MNTLKWVLDTQLKIWKQQKNNDGFTLIELLVAMVLAFLVITPLLGFMINVLDTDRQEQAKANSEQEIQAAADFITRDLQQSFYIYDATGVNAIKSQLPSVTGGEPVLVFWKREFAKDAAITKTKDNSGKDITFKDDAFVYSLVAYYLIKDNNANWSEAARIARFQIQDGYLNSNGSTCHKAYDTTRKFSICPDIGFKPLDLSQNGQTITQKMNNWEKASEDYKQVPIVLIDFIDQTTTAKGAPTVTSSSSCPSGFSIVPSSIDNASTSTTNKTGFYACVQSVSSNNQSVAEIYLRGNALARLTNDGNKINYNSNKITYFPQAKVRVEGRSFIFTK